MIVILRISVLMNGLIIGCRKKNPTVEVNKNPDTITPGIKNDRLNSIKERMRNVYYETVKDRLSKMHSPDDSAYVNSDTF